MSVEALTTALADIRARLGRGEYSDEAKVSNGIVRRVLDLLGWPVYDPSTVIPEHAIGTRKVDFALIGTDPEPAVLLEVKKVGNIDAGEDQLFEYAFYSGTPMVVLTDGQEWRFYLTGAGGNYRSRCFYDADLRTLPSEPVSQSLSRYLDYGAVRSEEATKNAQSDLKRKKSKKKAVETLPAAWDVVSRSPELVGLMVVEVEKLCGVTPPTESTAEFLVSLQRQEAQQRDSERTRQKARRSSKTQRIAGKETKPERSEVTDKVEGDGQCSFTLDGTTTRFRNGANLLVGFLATLARRDPSLLPKLSAAYGSKGRGLVARSKTDVYPGSPTRQAEVYELPGGWFVGTNMDTRHKKAMLRRACEIVGMDFEDLRITIPIRRRQKKSS